MRAHEFITNAGELANHVGYIDCLNNGCHKLSNVEIYYYAMAFEMACKNNQARLFETLSPSILADMRSLVDQFPEPTVIGTKCFIIPIAVFHDVLYVSDCRNNNPPTFEAEFAEYIGDDGITQVYKFEDGSVGHYSKFSPKPNSMFATICAPSVDAYEELRTMFMLKYDKSLPEVKQ